MKDYAVTFRLPGDPTGPAYIDGPRRTVVQADSIAEAANKVIAEFEGAEVVTVKPVEEAR